MPAISRIWYLLPICLISTCSRQHGPTRDELHARILSLLRQGDLPAAHRMLSDVHDSWRKDEASAWCWRFRFLQAELARTEGNLAVAGSLLSRSVPKMEEQRQLEARRHLQLGYLALKAGRYDKADKLLEEAKLLGNSDRYLQLEIEVAQSILAQYTLTPPGAENALKEAYQHALKLNDSYYQAALLNNFGNKLLNHYHYDEAAAYLQRAVEMADRCHANLIASSAMGNLAICSYKLGDFAKAKKLRLRAADIQRRVGARDKLQVSLGEFGNIEYLQGNPGRAIPFYMKALAIARDVGDREFALVWAVSLATAHAEVRNWAAAEQTIKDMRQWGSTQDDPELSAELRFDEAAISTGRDDYERAFRLYYELLRSKTGDPSVLWRAHAKIAELCARTGHFSDARKQFEEALLIINKTRLSLLQNDYQISFLNGLIRFYQQYVDFLIGEGDELSALAVADSSRARALTGKLGVEYEPRTGGISPKEIATRTDSVVLFYWLARERSYLWLIADGQLKLFPLPGQDTIASLVKKHQKAILDLWDPVALALPASRELASLLLGPAKPYISAGRKVIIVPDGELYGLSFDTLPEGDHYWIDEASFAIAPSLSMLNSKTPQANGRGPLLLMGDPAYQSSEFPKLIYAKEELRAIQDVSQTRSNVLHTGVDATPSMYRASSPGQFALIHFTAHAVANADSPLDSAIILAPDRRDAFKLYARDVIEYPLKAELVTVSGCRSAGARSFAGEGLIGFAWAFLKAGAQSVIAGLWDVDDRSTAQTMTWLYGGVESGKLPIDSLYQAKLAMRHSSGRYKKPYYWAPFQIYIHSYDALRSVSLPTTDRAAH